jgi:hypothetical protein
MLAALGILGGTAMADDDYKQPVSADAGVAGVSQAGGSYRSVSNDYLVMPEGGELTGQMRFITADPILANQPLKFTDLALFGLSARYSVLSKLQLGAEVDLLPKQPSYTDEKPWQSVGASARTPLGHRGAVAISAGGGHLIDHQGMWTREALTLEWKKEIIRRVVSFDLQGGVDALELSSQASKANALVTEVAGQTSALFSDPEGHFGGWVGIAYAVPVQSSGRDPTTDMKLDPQPRLDFHAGAVLSLTDDWDLFGDFAVIDRGDAQNPATRLPILDGGFDQKQIIMGVTRHFKIERHHHYDNDEAPLLLGSR